MRDRVATARGTDRGHAQHGQPLERAHPRVNAGQKRCYEKCYEKACWPRRRARQCRDAAVAVATKRLGRARVATMRGPDRVMHGTASCSRGPIQGRTRANTGAVRDTASGHVGCAGRRANVNAAIAFAMKRLGRARVATTRGCIVQHDQPLEKAHPRANAGRTRRRERHCEWACYLRGRARQLS